MKKIVEFYTENCGGCKMVKSELMSLEQEGFIVEYKNYEENKEEAEQLGIQGVPTIILYEDGKEYNRLVGYRPVNMIKDAYNGGAK